MKKHGCAISCFQFVGHTCSCFVAHRSVRSGLFESKQKSLHRQLLVICFPILVRNLQMMHQIIQIWFGLFWHNASLVLGSCRDAHVSGNRHPLCLTSLFYLLGSWVISPEDRNFKCALSLIDLSPGRVLLDHVEEIGGFNYLCFEAGHKPQTIGLPEVLTFTEHKYLCVTCSGQIKNGIAVPLLDII